MSRWDDRVLSDILGSRSVVGRRLEHLELGEDPTAPSELECGTENMGYDTLPICESKTAAPHPPTRTPHTYRTADSAPPSPPPPYNTFGADHDTAAPAPPPPYHTLGGDHDTTAPAPPPPYHTLGGDHDTTTFRKQRPTLPAPPTYSSAMRNARNQSSSTSH